MKYGRWRRRTGPTDLGQDQPGPHRCGSPQQNFWQRDPAFSRCSQQQDNQRQFEAIGAIGTPKQGRLLAGSPSSCSDRDFTSAITLNSKNVIE